jgi:hypothetical protein
MDACKKHCKITKIFGIMQIPSTKEPKRTLHISKKNANFAHENAPRK